MKSLKSLTLILLTVLVCCSLKAQPSGFVASSWESYWCAALGYNSTDAPSFYLNSGLSTYTDTNGAAVAAYLAATNFAATNAISIPQLPSSVLTNNATRGTVNLNSLSLAGSLSSDNAHIFTDGSGNLTAQSLTGLVIATGGNILTNAVATTGTNNAVSVANNTVTVQFNTNAATGGVANGGVLAKYISYNIPTPFAWYDAAQIPGAAAGFNPTNWPDATGNTNNLLIAANPFGFGTPYFDWQPNSCSGNPAVITHSGAQVAFTNSMFGQQSITNFTIFAVYLPNNRVNGATELGVGSVGFQGVTLGQLQVGGGQPQIYACWQAPINDANIGLNIQPANCVSISAMRMGAPSAQAYYQDGRLQEYNFKNQVYILTNMFALFSAPYAVISSLGGVFDNNSSIAEILIYTNTLSDFDVNRVNSYLRTRYNYNVKNLVIDCSSDGQAYWSPINSNLVSLVRYLLPSWEVQCTGQGALTMAQVYQNTTNVFSSGKWPGGTVDILWAGGTDTTLSGLTSSVPAYVSFLRNRGIAVGICTQISRAAYDTTYPTIRTNYNNYIYSNAASMGCFIVDLAANTNIGAINAYSNSYYFVPYPADQVPHPSTNAYTQIIAPTIANQIATNPIFR